MDSSTLPLWTGPFLIGGVSGYYYFFFIYFVFVLFYFLLLFFYFYLIFYLFIYFFFLLLPCFAEIPVLDTNSVDPDQKPRSVASDLGLHCLQMSLLWDARL